MESSVSKITIGFIWRLVVYTFCLAYGLEILLRLFLGSIAFGSGSAIFHIEGIIRFFRLSFILTILCDLIICYLTCKFTTDEIIKKYDVTTNREAVIRSITLIIIVIAVGMISYQVYKAQKASTEISKIQTEIEQTTTNLTDENEVSDYTKINAFAKWIKGMLIVSILTHAGTYIAIIGCERMWLERA